MSISSLFKTKPKPSLEEVRRKRQSWVGKHVLAAQTIEVTDQLHPLATVRYPTVTSARHISGKVTGVGDRTIKIDAQWYEMDSSTPGGIRIVEILQGDNDSSTEG
jgi:hypothetical protein